MNATELVEQLRIEAVDCDEMAELKDGPAKEAWQRSAVIARLAADRIEATSAEVDRVREQNRASVKSVRPYFENLNPLKLAAILNGTDAPSRPQGETK